MAGETIGLDACLYISEDLLGDEGGPTWEELEPVGEVTINDTRNEGTVKDRRSQFEKTKLGQRVYSIDATVTHVKGDATLAAVRAAYETGVPIAVAAMTGDIETPGEEGMQLDCYVTAMTSPQPFEDIQTVDITFKPAAESDEEPVYVVVEEEAPPPG
ncbi:hypothetical protein [Planctomicrobium sp. SH664]|uniref:hypothetical protein n=1 Tax=Planctomicrobium sp. SH664 TaxID=3448125 RepID=UPI003F5BBE6A